MKPIEKTTINRLYLDQIIPVENIPERYKHKETYLYTEYKILESKELTVEFEFYIAIGSLVEGANLEMVKVSDFINEINNKPKRCDYCETDLTKHEGLTLCDECIKG